MRLGLLLKVVLQARDWTIILAGLLAGLLLVVAMGYDNVQRPRAASPAPKGTPQARVASPAPKARPQPAGVTPGPTATPVGGAREQLTALVPAGFLLEETLRADLNGDGQEEWVAFYGNAPIAPDSASVASRCMVVLVTAGGWRPTLVMDAASPSEPADFGYNREPPTVASYPGGAIKVHVRSYRRGVGSQWAISWAGECCGGYVASRVGGPR